MSYSGEGTQQNPFVLGASATCSDYFTLVTTQLGAYIKLETDLDFSTDPQYREGVTDVWFYVCAKVYADTKPGGGKYYINGFKNTSNCPILNQGSQTLTFENIQLTNWVFNKASDQAYFIYGNSYPIIFNNCDISLYMNCVNYNKSLSYGSGTDEFNDCSLYIIIAGSYEGTSQNPPILGSVCTFTNCCIQIDGLTYCGYPNAVNPNGDFCNLTRCTLLVDMQLPKLAEIGQDYPYYLCLSNITNSCLALTIHNGPLNTGGYKIIEHISFYNLVAPTTIIDTSILDTNVVQPTAETNLVPLTTAQMKNQTKLLEIGFLL